MSNKNSNAPTKAQRKAQSARDKAANAKKQPRQPKQPRQRAQRTRGPRGDRAGQIDSAWVDNSMLRGGGNGGQMRSEPQKTGRICKRELITLVSGTTGFQALKFAINPGLASLLPVGSAEAKNWTEWRCTKMLVQYIPTVSEFATQGQQGEVAIAVDYNADNVPPTAMNQIEAMQFAGAGIPSKGFDFWAVPKLLNKADPKYIRTGPVPASADLRLFDGGSLYFATSGCTNTTQIGKLEIDYEFELGLPTLLNQGGGNLAGDANVAQFQSTTAEDAGASGVDAIMAFASVIANGLGVVNTAGSFVPPPGVYRVDALWTTSNSAAHTTEALLDIRKNGTSLFLGQWNKSLWDVVDAVAAYTTNNLSAIVSCDGTDAITVVGQATYGSGTVLTGGSVIFTRA